MPPRNDRLVPASHRFRDGAPWPKTDDFDVVTWQGPRVFRAHYDHRWIFATLLVLLAAPSLLRVTTSWSGDLSDLAFVTALVAYLGAIGVVFVIPARWYVRRRMGWVTLDPKRQLITWNERRNPGGPPDAEWEFSRLLDVTVGQGTAAVSTLHMALSDRELVIDVPTAHAETLAASLRRGADGGGLRPRGGTESNAE